MASQMPAITKGCTRTHLARHRGSKELTSELTEPVDSNDLAQVASINFSRLDLSSSLQNISKNVFGLSLGALEIVLLIFLEILSSS